MNNTPVVIPQKVTRGEELVVVPRREYEGLVRFYSIQGKKKKKQHKKLPKGLQEALNEVKAGKVSKAFDNADGFMRSLLS